MAQSRVHHSKQIRGFFVVFLALTQLYESIKTPTVQYGIKEGAQNTFLQVKYEEWLREDKEEQRWRWIPLISLL